MNFEIIEVFEFQFRWIQELHIYIFFYLFIYLLTYIIYLFIIRHIPNTVIAGSERNDGKKRDKKKKSEEKRDRGEGRNLLPNPSNGWASNGKGIKWEKQKEEQKKKQEAAAAAAVVVAEEEEGVSDVGGRRDPGGKFGGGGGDDGSPAGFGRVATKQSSVESGAEAAAGPERAHSFPRDKSFGGPWGRTCSWTSLIA